MSPSSALRLGTSTFSVLANSVLVLQCWQIGDQAIASIVPLIDSPCLVCCHGRTIHRIARCRRKIPGAYGSCWAFSTIGAVEGIVQIKTGQLLSLSEQGLISCDTSDGNAGCEGGLPYLAFLYIMQNGAASEAAYPYTSQDGWACNEQIISVASIAGREKLPANNGTALQQAVAMQPVSVSIDGPMFQSYASGILDGYCSSSLDHAVVAVGYGTDPSGEDYWILKNSWGQGWGEAGYVRFKRNVLPYGICGVAMDADYPTKN